MITETIKNLQIEAAKGEPQRMAFPESSEELIVRAARQVFDMGIAYPILIGNMETVSSFAKEIGVSLEGMTVVDNTDEEKCTLLIDEYIKSGGDLSEKSLKRKMKDPLNFAMLLARTGQADCVAAGKAYTTGEVLLSAQAIIGMKKGISTVSSIGIWDVPGFEGSEGNLLAFSDAAVCIAPDENELADIAISSADTVASLFGWEPRIGMMTFSTTGSSEHETIDTVRKAIEIVRERRPGLKIDGEFQFDSAIIPAVAAKKVKRESDVAGKANVVIFPNIHAGNIGVKIAQIFAKCNAYGPMLQGFARPVTDFSRSAPLEEIVGNLVMLALRSRNSK